MQFTSPLTSMTSGVYMHSYVRGGPANCRLQLFYPFCLHLQPNFWGKSTSTKNDENLQSTTQNTINIQLPKNIIKTCSEVNNH